MKRVLMLLCLLLVACTDTRQERASRQAVKSLLAAPADKVNQETAKVVALGRYVLPDIEQEIHGATSEGRLRLIEALKRLGDPEVLPLLETLVRWETSEPVRKRAKDVASLLGSLPAGK